MKRRTLTFVGCIVATITLFVVGCSTLQVDRSQAQLDAVSNWVNTQKVSAVDANDPKAIAFADQLSVYVAQAQHALSNVVDPNGAVTAESAGKAISSALPTPYNFIASAFITMLVGATQELRVRRAVRAAKSIINAVDVVRMKSDTIKAEMKDPRTKLDYEAQLSPMARTLIEQEAIT